MCIFDSLHASLLEKTPLLYKPAQQAGGMGTRILRALEHQLERPTHRYPMEPRKWVLEIQYRLTSDDPRPSSYRLQYWSVAEVLVMANEVGWSPV